MSDDGPRGLALEGDEPVGWWCLGIVTTVLLLAVTDALDVSSAGCGPGLAMLPVPAFDATVFASCVVGPGLVPFLLSDVALIAAYWWVLRGCARWCRTQRRSPVVGRIGRIATWTVTAAAVADLAENVLLYVASEASEASAAPVRVPVAILSILKWLLLAAPVLSAGAVGLIGLRQVALPWAVPPTSPPVVPGGEGSPGPVPGIEPGQDATRWYVWPDGSGVPVPFERDDESYGVGLSGGGIRSAAFCSGVLAAIDGSDRWSPSSARYLATVSGGGYVGVSTQMIRHRPEPHATHPDPYAASAPETALVRARQRYLGDGLVAVRFVVAFLAGIALNIVLVAGPLLVLGAVLAVLDVPPPSAVSRVPLLVVASLALFAAAVLWQVCAAERDALLPRPPEERIARVLRPVSGVLIVAGCAVLLWIVEPGPWWAVPIVGFAALGLVSLRTARRRTTPGIWLHVSQALFSSAWVAVALLLVGLTAHGTLGNPTSWPDYLADPVAPGTLVGALVFYLALFLLSDQTWWSPHPFYKARIAGTFAVERSADGAGADTVPFATYTYLDEWAVRPPDGPELVVCATANLDDLSVPPAGSRAAPFAFTHDAVGSPEIGWWHGSNLRRALGARLAADGTLQAATAISGAAVASSGTGVRGRIPTAGTLIALLNARLGVWLPNPRSDAGWPEKGLAARWTRRRRPVWLWREVVGTLPGRKRYLYVSDGGHLDNLGLIELLRRRMARILVVDASADADLTTGTLDWVLDLATKHLGVVVRDRTTAGSSLNTTAPSGTLAMPDGRVAADCVERIEIDYPASIGGGTATVYVAKARFATTLACDPDAVDLAAQVAGGRRWWPWSVGTVPTTMTANQFLTDAQFEAYVRLGHAVGARLLRADDPPPGRGDEPPPGRAEPPLLSRA